MEKKCVVCHDRTFAFRCIQCHKPVCDECSFKTEHGAFCSRNCAASYRDYMKAQGPRTRRRSGLLKLLLVVALLAALAVAIAYVVAPDLLPLVPGLGGQ